MERVGIMMWSRILTYISFQTVFCIVFAHGDFDDRLHKYLDDGGWKNMEIILPEITLLFTAEEELIAFAGPCNIDVREAKGLSQAEFLERYAFNKPVVIRGATDNTVFQDECRKDKMMSQHYDKKIRLSTANRNSYDKKDVSLKTYVDEFLKPQTLDMLGNETYYWFGDNNFTEWKSLIDLYRPPPYYLPKMTGAYSFGLAGAGTGVPFHFHGPGFGEVVFGRKRWFLYPPDTEINYHPNKTTLQWLYQDYPHLSEMPLECTMKKGELIYFPDRWWHGTLNIDTSVFISTFLAS